MPGDIMEKPDWNTRTGLEKNLESNMDFAEHQRIAFDALQLLEGDLAVEDNAAGNKLRQLKEAYEGNDLGDVLYISKGIHQPATNPHMQLQLKRSNSWYTFHLNVSVSSNLIQGLPEKYFHWVGVQFTAEADTFFGKVNACWPLVAALDAKSQHSRRRLSIAPKDVQHMINAIAVAKQKAQDEANRKEQARLAQQNRDKLRNTIKDLLGKGFYKFSGTKDLDQLFAGQTINATTKTGKPIKLKFEDGKIKQA
jgi:hypothetical protein